MAFLSNHRSWLLAAFAATHLAACAAMNFGAGNGGRGGSDGGGYGANSGTGGSIDYDAGGGGASSGDYSKLCGPGVCDVARQSAIPSCSMGGAGGSGGSIGGAGGAGGFGGATSGGAAGAGNGGAGGATTGGAAGAGNGGAGAGGLGGMGAGGLGGMGGATGSTGGLGGAGNGGAGGASGGAGAGGLGGMGGAGGATGGATGGGGASSDNIECKLVFDADVSRACVPSGDGAESAPCNTAADCGPGLGCVLLGDQPTGVCRTYCCGDTELCAPHTYCAPRPMTEAGDPNVVIPVCIDADDCTLLSNDQCDPPTVCTVVRGDGTTACMPPGPGKQGDPCPCAEGYACTKLNDECYEICHTDPGSQTKECDPGYSCQGNAATLPDGFGLCISTSDVQ